MRSKKFVADYLQPILTELEEFFSKWRTGLNPEKTKIHQGSGSKETLSNMKNNANS